jgi:hypothetical protein
VTRRVDTTASRSSAAAPAWGGRPVPRPCERLGDGGAIPRLHAFRGPLQPGSPGPPARAVRARGLGRVAGGLPPRAHDAPLVATFYSPASPGRIPRLTKRVLLRRHRLGASRRLWRRWHPRDTRIHYFAPSTGSRGACAPTRPGGAHRLHRLPAPAPAGRRPRPHRVCTVTVAARLARLDPRGVFRLPVRGGAPATLGVLPPPDVPPHLVFAVGGAGAQADCLASSSRASRAALRRGASAARDAGGGSQGGRWPGPFEARDRRGGSGR